MRFTRLADCPCYPIFAMALLSGCQSFYDYRPVPVLVLDAETKKPIPEADVRISYPFTHSSFSPFDSTLKTGSDGIARLRAAPCGDHVLLLEAKSKGYMTCTQDISDDAIRKIKPQGWFEMTERPPAVTVAMYAEPRFFIDLVVPNCYSGLVKAAVQFKDEVPCPAGQRGFSFEVNLAGDVQVTGPAVMLRYTPVFHARFADGTRLSEEMDALKVGFRWLKREGNVEYFAIGTQFDFDRLRRIWVSNPTSSAASASDSGKSSPKGGRRRGNQVTEQ